MTSEYPGHIDRYEQQPDDVADSNGNRYLADPCSKCGGPIRAEDGDEFLDGDHGVEHVVCYPVDYDSVSCRIEWEFYPPSSPTVLAGLDRVFTFISSRGTESPWWADR